MRDDALGALEHPTVRSRLRGRQHIGQVVARLPLAMSEGQSHAALADRRQGRRFLRIVARQTQSGATKHHRR